VLHRVGEVRAVAGDAGVAERRVQEPASGAHERLALPVLAVTGLLTDQDDSGVGRAVAEYRLAGPLVQIAALAAERGPRQRREVPGARNAAAVGYPCELATWTTTLKVAGKSPGRP
jgi:hypothetical protein